MRCTKLLSKVYVEQNLEALVYFCDKTDIYYDTHSPLISSSTVTRYFAAVAVLNTCVCMHHFV